jgi:hypothetical protein
MCTCAIPSIRMNAARVAGLGVGSDFTREDSRAAWQQFVTPQASGPSGRYRL